MSDWGNGRPISKDWMIEMTIRSRAQRFEGLTDSPDINVDKECFGMCATMCLWKCFAVEIGLHHIVMSFCSCVKYFTGAETLYE